MRILISLTGSTADDDDVSLLIAWGESSTEDIRPLSGVRVPSEEALEIDPLEAIPTIPTVEVTQKLSPVAVEQDAPSKHFAESEAGSTTSKSFETGDPPQKFVNLCSSFRTQTEKGLQVYS